MVWTDQSEISPLRDFINDPASCVRILCILLYMLFGILFF